MHCMQALKQCERAIDDANDVQFSLLVALLTSLTIHLICAKTLTFRRNPKRQSHAVQTDPEVVRIIVHPDESIQLLSLQSSDVEV